MGKPAARIADNHVCPMVTPGVPPVPHVGGPIVGPGCPTVLICNMPAAVLGDSCVCVGPPDAAIIGSMGVLIGGKPALRMGDSTAHGGTIVMGAPTVLIGESSPGGAVTPMPPIVLAQIASAKKEAMQGQKPKAKKNASFSSSLGAASQNGSPFIHQCEVC